MYSDVDAEVKSLIRHVNARLRRALVLFLNAFAVALGVSLAVGWITNWLGFRMF